MKNLLLIIFVLFTFSCSNKINQAYKTEHNSKNAIDWTGTYVGTLPCSDCEGMVTFISLNDDYSYSKRSIHLKDDHKTFEEVGHFSWNNEGNKINLVATNSNLTTNYFVSENSITQLDKTGKKITGKLSEYYTLSKYASTIYERYWKLAELNGKAIKIDSTFKSEIYLIFKAHNNHIIGSSGCDSVDGKFILYRHNNIKITSLNSNDTICLSAKTTNNFLETTKMANYYEVEADNLYLKNDKHIVLAKFTEVLLR